MSTVREMRASLFLSLGLITITSVRGTFNTRYFLLVNISN